MKLLHDFKMKEHISWIIGKRQIRYLYAYLINNYFGSVVNWYNTIIFISTKMMWGSCVPDFLSKYWVLSERKLLPNALKLRKVKSLDVKWFIGLSNNPYPNHLHFINLFIPMILNMSFTFRLHLVCYNSRS